MGLFDDIYVKVLSKLQEVFARAWKKTFDHQKRIDNNEVIQRHVRDRKDKHVRDWLLSGPKRFWIEDDQYVEASFNEDGSMSNGGVWEMQGKGHVIVEWEIPTMQDFEWSKLTYRKRPFEHMVVKRGDGEGIWVTDPAEDRQRGYEWLLESEKRIWSTDKDFLDFYFGENGVIVGSDGTDAGNWSMDSEGDITMAYTLGTEQKNSFAKWVFDDFWHLQIVKGDFDGAWLLDKYDQEPEYALITAQDYYENEDYLDEEEERDEQDFDDDEERENHYEMFFNWLVSGEKNLQNDFGEDWIIQFYPDGRTSFNG